MATSGQNIKINVEGIELPVTVTSAEQEKLYRDAASLLQSRVQRYRSMYPNMPNDKYYYIMAMLNMSIDAVKAANDVSLDEYKASMESLTKEINALDIK